MELGFSLSRWAAALATVLVLAMPVRAAGFNDPEDLPEGLGREETFYACIACHSMQVVVRQGMSREMWEDTIRLMVERHGMPELDPKEKALIINYLSENFTASTGSRRGWINPFAP